MKKQFRQRWMICILIIALLITAFALTYPTWLPMFYSYLNISQPPRLTNIIVVLGGGNGQREIYAAQLYMQGYAPNVLVSGSSSELINSMNLIKANGVPENALLNNDQATSTYDEAQ